MRLARLDLELFGHFKDFSLDFGTAEGSDFHVVHGPNEAGKTTTMEGFLRLLYGFPHRDPYDFRHQRKNLRVSGVLEVGGQPQVFRRLPSRTASLTDGNGTPLPENALTAHLGGLGLDDYRKLLCLDDETIERGGEDIAGSKGEIGHLLFSAAAGISDLGALLDQVQAQANALYLKGGSKSRIAHLRKEIAEIDRQIRERDIGAHAYRSLQDSLAAAKIEEADLRKDRDALAARRAEVHAQLSALPMRDKLDQLTARIAPYAAYPEDVDISPDDLLELLTEDTRARAEHTRLEGRIADLTQERDAVERRPEDLSLADPLAEVEDQRVRFRAAERDLARRRAERDELVAEMRRTARDIDPSGTIDPSTRLPGLAETGVLTQALERLHAARGAVDRTGEEVTAIARRVEDAEAELHRRQAVAPDANDIAAVLERFGLERLVPAHAAARQAIATARAALRDAMRDLGLDPADPFPEVPVSEAEVEELSVAWDQISAAHAKAEDTLVEQQEDHARRSGEAAHFQASEGVIDDATAQQARQDRDALWATHRDTLTPDSADAFRAAMDHADQIADARLDHAQAIGELRALRRSEASTALRLEQAQARLAAVEVDRDAMAARISDICVACGLPETTGMRALQVWLKRHGTAKRAQAALARVSEDHGDVMAKAAALDAALRPLIDAAHAGFDDLIALASARADAARTHAEEARRAEALHADLTRDMARRTRDAEAARSEAEDAARCWQEAVRTQLGEAVDAARLETTLGALGPLREQDATRRQLDRQVRGMETDQAQFKDAVAALMADKGLPATGQPLSDFETLSNTLRDAEDAERRWHRLQAEIDATSEKLAEATRRIGDISDRVTGLSRAFDDSIPTSSLQDLREAVAIADRTNTARAALRDLTADLCRALDLPDIAAVRAHLDGVSEAALTADLTTLDSDLHRVDAQLGVAIEARTNATRDLAAVTGTTDITRLAERKATLDLEWEDAVSDYLELRLGHKLAEEAIRRYRDIHRSDMMAATERAFAALTDGAYRDLRAEPDGGDDILVAVDAAGQAKQARDMSKGTRFQLYLALRAAAYEQLLGQGISLPFLCDDIFETFDEDRTRAACRMMAQIGQRGQAIYLTHHAHVVEIAREVCGDAVRVHRLDR